MNSYAAGRIKAAYILGIKPDTFGHAAELVGLGTLAAYPAYHLYHAIKNDEPVGQHVAEIAGLGILAAPTILSRFHKT